jgi:hypothetical protein
MISRATRYLPALRLRYSIVANISKKLLHTENGFIAIDEIRNPSKVALAYDVMLQDSSPKDIVYLAKQFGIEHTGASQRPKKFPVVGLVYIGELETFHAWFPMVVSYRSREGRQLINLDCVMIYDTGSPRTFLCDNTLKSLGFIGDIIRGINIQVNGLPQVAYPSHGVFKDVDVLGQDFIRNHGLEARIRGKSLTCVIKLETEEAADEE